MPPESIPPEDPEPPKELPQQMEAAILPPVPGTMPEQQMPEELAGHTT